MGSNGSNGSNFLTHAQTPSNVWLGFSFMRAHAGILACASVWPIISVLAMEGFRRLMRWGKTRKESSPHTGHIQMF
jgi:hypothetical protein